MRKTVVLMGVLFAALAGISGSLPIMNAHGQAAGGGGQPAQVAPGGAGGDDMPTRTAKAFAPFLRAVVTRRINQAQRLFKIRRSVETYLDQPEVVQILGRFTKPDSMDLNLVGGRTLGQNIGILYFTVATENVPVAFKIYYYGYGQDMYVAKMEIVDTWDEVEQLASTVDILPQPITVSMGFVVGAEVGGGGE